MKAYTDIEQSRKLLALGIPTDSADMFYSYGMNIKTMELSIDIGDIPCWSLAALLEMMPNAAGREYNLVFNSEECYIAFDDCSKNIHKDYEGNTPLDAAYNMIIWLKENKYI